MSTWKKGIFVSDTQAPYHKNSCIALYCEFAKRYKPDQVILGGDMIDLYSLSRFPKVGRKFDYVTDELHVAEKEVITPILKASPKAEFIWLQGNHEARLQRIIAEHFHALTGFPGLSIQEAFRMEKRKIQWIQGKGNTENGIYAVNRRLLTMHGKKTGINAAKATAERYGEGCVIQGHVHKRQMYSRTTGSGSHIQGIASPCMCEDPDFGDGLNDYTRGFVTYQWKGDYQYQVQFQDMDASGTELYANQLGDVPKTMYAKWVAKDKKWKVTVE